jgi:hypothetical protein
LKITELRGVGFFLSAGGDPRVVDDEADVRPKGTKGEEEESRVLSEPDPTSGMTELTPNKDGGGRKSDEETLGGEGKGKEGEERGHAAEKHKVTLPTVSNYTIHDTEDTENGKQDDGAYPHSLFIYASRVVLH